VFCPDCGKGVDEGVRFHPTVGRDLRKDLLLKKEKIIFRDLRYHMRQG
jgi:hypothetical protein